MRKLTKFIKLVDTNKIFSVSEELTLEEMRARNATFFENAGFFSSDAAERYEVYRGQLITIGRVRFSHGVETVISAFLFGSTESGDFFALNLAGQNFRVVDDAEYAIDKVLDTCSYSYGMRHLSNENKRTSEPSVSG